MAINNTTVTIELQPQEQAQGAEQVYEGFDNIEPMPMPEPEPVDGSSVIVTPVMPETPTPAPASSTDALPPIEDVIALYNKARNMYLAEREKVEAANAALSEEKDRADKAEKDLASEKERADKAESALTDAKEKANEYAAKNNAAWKEAWKVEKARADKAEASSSVYRYSKAELNSSPCYTKSNTPDHGRNDCLIDLGEEILAEATACDLDRQAIRAYERLYGKKVENKPVKGNVLNNIIGGAACAVAHAASSWGWTKK